MLSAANRNAPEPQVGSRTVTLLDGVPEGAQQVRPFAVLDHVLRELADVEIERDQVVDVADLAGGELRLGLPRSAAGGRRLRARFRWAGRYSAGAGLFQPLRAQVEQAVALGGVDARRRSPVGSGHVHAVPDGGVDVAVGVVAQQVPDGRAVGILEGDLALGAGGVEQERDDRVLADVFGDVFLGVVRPHLLLVDVLLEDVAEHVGVDLVVGAQRALVEVPLVLVEEVEDALEGLVGNLDVWRMRCFELVHLEEAAVEIRDCAEQLFQLRRCASCAAEPFVEQAQQEVAVEGIELVLALLAAAQRRAGCAGSRGRRRESPSSG